MRPETTRAIMNNWAYCSAAMQRALIRHFLELYEEVNGTVWLHFLAEEFGIEIEDDHRKTEAESH